MTVKKRTQPLPRSLQEVEAEVGVEEQVLIRALTPVWLMLKEEVLLERAEARRWRLAVLSLKRTKREKL